MQTVGLEEVTEGGLGEGVTNLLNGIHTSWAPKIDASVPSTDFFTPLVQAVVLVVDAAMFVTMFEVQIVELVRYKTLSGFLPMGLCWWIVSTLSR
jgi:hypothetical protein